MAVILQYLLSMACYAAYNNYSSVLVGEKAAGLGGAFTAALGDPAASAYYNPGALARARGSAFVASSNVYHKFDIEYDEQQGKFEKAPLRVNRGSLIPIPASSGTVHTFGNFAFGISILMPDFETMSGEVQNSTESPVYMNLRDESLWVGGSIAKNFARNWGLGLSMYYTARNFTRSTTDQTTTGSTVSLTNEEKVFSQNSLIYILGGLIEIGNKWKLGASFRFRSIPISGSGTFLRTQITNDNSAVETVSYSGVKANTKVPSRFAFGVNYTPNSTWAFSFDVTRHGPVSYQDLIAPQGSDEIEHLKLWNAHIGVEKKVSTWLSWRSGIYSNLSSSPLIPDTVDRRYSDHIDMWGFSTNFAIYTSDKSHITLGGYYTGGRGHSTPEVGQQFIKVQKSMQIFSLLVATGSRF